MQYHLLCKEIILLTLYGYFLEQYYQVPAAATASTSFYPQNKPVIPRSTTGHDETKGSNNLLVYSERFENQTEQKKTQGTLHIYVVAKLIL